MFYGDGLSNITFDGGGTIDGGGHFITGNPKSGQADKLISLTRCDGLTLNGITLRNGGHFAILTNACNNITSDHLTISTASNRDGWNVINAQHVRITNITDAANDDALVFKSDWALGQTINNGDVTVTTAHLSAQCCNALMFGSETCGNFTNYTFTDITITHAGKSGLGMVSMDGANISNVTYNNVTMSGTASPIMEKIGHRLRCGGSPTVGSISDIHYNGVTGTNAGAFSPTLWGQSGHDISNVTFSNVNLTLPGGHAAMSTGVPSDNGDYNPNSIGTRPAYGFYLHNVTGISFMNSSVRFSKNDGRPAFIVNSGGPVTFDHVTAQSGTGSPFDMGFQTVSGFCVTSSTNTGGGMLRINSTGSTPSC
jgi:polygalacturonase